MGLCVLLLCHYESFKYSWYSRTFCTKLNILMLFHNKYENSSKNSWVLKWSPMLSKRFDQDLFKGSSHFILSQASSLPIIASLDNLKGFLQNIWLSKWNIRKKKYQLFWNDFLFRIFFLITRILNEIQGRTIMNTFLWILFNIYLNSRSYFSDKNNILKEKQRIYQLINWRRLIKRYQQWLFLPFYYNL